MLTLKALIAAYFAITCFDAWLTNARMNKYGADVELTPAIRKMAKAISPEFATIVGILAPSTAVCALCFLFRAPVIVALLLGFRLHFFYIQLQSIAFEKQLEKFKREHPDVFGGQSSETALPPPARPGITGDSTTAPLNSNGEEKHG